MRVLVTRPLEDVGPLVAALKARGHEAVVEPMLSIERRADVTLPLPLDGVQALLFTSANGVRAFADLAPERDLPVFAVGDASATAARAAGFTAVESAGGDVTDLARLVRVRLDPDKGALFHPAASQLAGDLQGALEDAGFTLRRAALYEAQPAVELSSALRRALAAGDLDAAVFFSPRTARTFVGLVERAGLNAACARLQAVCLSEAVAARLQPLAWARVCVAARPEQEAVLARLDEVAAEVDASASGSPRQPAEGHLDAHDVVASFGGIRPMANKLGVAVSTVQGWRERGSIPAGRHAQIRAAAKKHGIQLEPAAIAASDQDGGPTSAAQARAPAAAPGVSGMSAVPGGVAEPPRESQEARAAAAAAVSASTGSPTIRLWGAFALGVIAVLVGAGLAIVGRDVWLAEPPAPVADAADAVVMASLDARLATVEGEVRDRAAGTGSPESEAAVMASLDARLATVEGEVRDWAAGLGSGESEAARAAMAPLEEELSAIQNRLDSLAKDVAAAAGPPGADAAAQTAALGEVQAQVQALGGRIDTLDERLANLREMQVQVQALGGRIDILDERLANLQNQLEEIAVAGAGSDTQTAGEAALTLAVLQLRDAVRGSTPFAAELQAVLDMATSPAFAGGADLIDAVTPLMPYAEMGAPALAKLKTDFPAVARRIVTQGQGADDEDWLAGVKRRVSGLISVRPIGSVEGESPAAVAARAEAALSADDLAGAVRELSALQGSAAAAAGDWRAGAEARLAVQTALNQLGRGLIARRGSGSE